MSDFETPNMPEKGSHLRQKFMDLMREMILEGVIDPSKGTEFTLIQGEATGPFASLEEIVEAGSHVVTAGIPNPLEYEFDRLVLNPEELRKRREQAINDFLDNDKDKEE